MKLVPMKPLTPPDKMVIEAYLRIALVTLNNATDKARQAAVASMAGFSEGASDTELVTRLRNLVREVATLRSDLEHYMR